MVGGCFAYCLSGIRLPGVRLSMTNWPIGCFHHEILRKTVSKVFAGFYAIVFDDLFRIFFPI